MKSEELLEGINRLRLHIKSDPELGEKFSALIVEACTKAGIKMPAEFFEGLVIVHQSEMDSEFSVTILPVGSQCGIRAA
jgi:hypothetical protein